MARSFSILRRYTPPTCTLEVMAKNSSLSRWANQPVLKDLKFKLSLDDPKLPKDQWITVRGDRPQLEALSEAVAAYLQTLLGVSQTPDDQQWENQDQDTGFALRAATPFDQAHNSSAALPPLPAASGVSLHSRSLLKHDLHLGPLATDGANSVIPLTTLQLFDLANALDDYSTDVLDLPTLDTPAWYKTPTGVAQIAAGILLVMGLSTSALKVLDHPAKPIVAEAPTSSQGASSSDQRIATQLPPAVAEKAASPPVISADRLPPPPATIATPKPGTSAVVVPKMPATSTTPAKPDGAIANTAVPGHPIVIGETRAKPKSEASQPAVVAVAPIAGIASQRNAAPQPFDQALARKRADAPSKATAFDTIPQVAEVRTYFQQHWKPPEELTETLEYRIMLGSDGKIQEIVPLKQRAGDYLDRTGMPLIGEPFVSPLESGQVAKIRLVLSPDGKVQTFLESSGQSSQ